jgi:3-oxoacyl-[acyl-carrier protein] reductase
VDLGLKEKVFVVTGGTRGLGRATAEVLVREGARVVVSSRTERDVIAVVADLGGEQHAHGVVADLAVEESAGTLVAAAEDRFGGLDGALISVGGPPGGDALAISDDQWRSSFESVFIGALRLARSVAATVRPGGALAFVLSSSVRSPIGGLAISNGLRPGLAMVAKSLADELGPKGVRVNGLMPGRVATDRIVSLDQATGDPDASRRRNEAAIPLRRYGAPEEFGNVAAFLLSPAASYVTGTMVPVDGGALRTI